MLPALTGAGVPALDLNPTGHPKMCGIAGIISIDGGSGASKKVIRAMTDAISHRGPDEEGYYSAKGLDFGSRRLSIVGLADGQQPVSNETGTINVVFNGELFDFPERKEQLQQRGHTLNTSCDTEILPHLWEDHEEAMFETLRGQFAIALHDKTSQRILLARDRFGICPLYWTVQTVKGRRFLLFASEIKALIASGMVEPRPDIRGIDQTFSFFALPGPVTCFEGVRMLKPGHFLRIGLGKNGNTAIIEEKPYWEISYPDRGDEDPGNEQTIDEYANLFRQAVERRLRADVPVVSYLSGGVDSAWVLATAKRLRDQAPESFTLQINSKGLDELPQAVKTAEYLGSPSTSIPIEISDMLDAYPRLIEAAECPVSDTVSTALLLLANHVHQSGYKVALTGEGSDEMLAGYPWFKYARFTAPIDAMGFRAGNTARRAAAYALGITPNDLSFDRRVFDAVGGANAWLDLYGLAGAIKHQVYGPRMRSLLNSHVPYEDLELDPERMKNWHPFNRSLFLGQRIHLPGLLLSIAGDRVAMHSSLETRYPFLDEDLCDFTQRLHPKWKLRRFQEKYLLRRAAERDLPREVAWRPKKMLKASWDILGGDESKSPFSGLLSEDALRATGYFEPEAVGKLFEERKRSAKYSVKNQALVAIATTQLWHHMYIEDLGAPIERIAFQKVS
ncbi:MAG: asparagine synthase (glutamine-hydrolyzing) [Rhizobiaceae bacterium]